LRMIQRDFTQKYFYRVIIIFEKQGPYLGIFIRHVPELINETAFYDTRTKNLNCHHIISGCKKNLIFALNGKMCWEHYV